MKKLFKLYIILPVLLVLLVGSVFAVWHLLPEQPLDVVVLNKTISFDKIDENNNKTADYRKHMGLYWILRYHRYINPEDHAFYNYDQDYYGPYMNADGTTSERTLAKLEKTPDLIYLSDAYGLEETAKQQESGLTPEEIAAVSTAHTHGSVVVGEFNIAPSKKDDPIRGELETLFGIQFSDWVGRFVPDLADKNDVPAWVVTLHEQNYGSPWNYTGAGILLASREGELLVLEKDKDYTGALTVQITDAFKSKYGKLNVNYYNWFEIITAEYGMDTIAQYNLPLTEQGKTKFSKISTSGSFPAIVANLSSAPTYYFAGDFNDYVAKERYGDFLFANTFTRIFTYDRPGDITNFYWNFYMPMMETVLKDAKAAGSAKTDALGQDAPVRTRINQNQLEFYDGNAWQPFTVKGFNINAELPGSQPYDYTHDISVYRYFLSSVGSMGGNCIRAYDLMPPQFYRALYEYNMNHPDQPILFYQSIIPPSNIAAGEYFSEAALKALTDNIHYTVDAVHGNAVVHPMGQRTGGTYINNVSPYLLGYIVELTDSADTIKKMNDANTGYSYTGTYVSGGAQSVPSEHLTARLCDELYAYQAQKYNNLLPVGARGLQALLPNSPWTQYSNGIRFDVSALDVSSAAQSSFFVCYSLQPSDSILLDHTASYANYTDETGSFAYGGYIRTFKTFQSRYPVLIDRVGLSTNVNVYEKENSVNGLTETQQGEGLVRILKAIRYEGYLGGLISDLNDSWSDCSNELAAYTIPMKNKPLWHNPLDPVQNTGVLSVEPEPVTQIGMSLQDTERMSEVIMQTDEEYLYLTVLLTQETDFSKEMLIIGLDTYHRSFGEYLYDPQYFATSLSGMEYVIKFESKENASIYVVPDYNREKGKYSPKESYTGQFDLVTRLQYGTFEFSNNNFYQTGATMHIRIPWGLLNFTDPANKMVLADIRTPEQVLADGYGLQTQSTGGIMFSLLIADRTTKDTLLIFPLNKQANGYKSFSWITWEKPTYQFRNKESFDILHRYFVQ